jgi:oligopeptide/dipeptide ABC transporter ATP-binding protein
VSVLTVSHLYKRFNLEAGFFARFGRFINAVNDISFTIGKNESYGLVGESGCGKTTTARLLVRMYEADSGEILFNSGDAHSGEADSEAPSGDTSVSVAQLKKEELLAYREKVRYVFQDPARSLNPRMSVYEVLVSGCRRPLKQKGISEKQLREKAAAILEEVGLQAADLEKRPSEFSGGQRQRISIARALLMEPQILICDEVVSALDVSIQGQILNLLHDIRERRGMSFLFIAHDLKVACYFCDKIGVMYKGELMEEAPAANLYSEALHPYTQLLFSSAAGIAKEESNFDPLCELRAANQRSDAPSCEVLGNESCSFAPRCPKATEKCYNEHPVLNEIKPGHSIRCFNINSAAL